jgi:hypothetical protein
MIAVGSCCAIRAVAQMPRIHEFCEPKQSTPGPER